MEQITLEEAQALAERSRIARTILTYGTGMVRQLVCGAHEARCDKASQTMAFVMLHRDCDLVIAFEDIDIHPLPARILDAIRVREKVTIAELAAICAVSESTIRRYVESDVDSLLNQGVLRVVDKGGDGRGNARTYAIDVFPDSERPDGET